MTRLTRNVRVCQLRPKLSLECLERRDLMAVVTSIVDPTLAEPIDAATIQTSTDFGGDRDRDRNLDLSGVEWRTIDGTGNNVAHANPRSGRHPANPLRLRRPIPRRQRRHHHHRAAARQPAHDQQCSSWPRAQACSTIGS